MWMWLGTPVTQKKSPLQTDRQTGQDRTGQGSEWQVWLPLFKVGKFLFNYLRHPHWPWKTGSHCPPPQLAIEPIPRKSCPVHPAPLGAQHSHYSMDCKLSVLKLLSSRWTKMRGSTNLPRFILIQRGQARSLKRLFWLKIPQEVYGNTLQTVSQGGKEETKCTVPMCNPSTQGG